ncbi:MAG TPA: helix-turn-helix transcriptional regulator [Burkholderiales bacterium]|nr:helix-turn-helix transcriptional regulator [Burkholderiales bacterium]
MKNTQKGRPPGQHARAARGRIPKRGLGLGAAIRRMREVRGIGQEVLAERSGISQGYLSQLEGGSALAVLDDTVSRIAAALNVEPWVVMAEAVGFKLDHVERFTEDERIWLDAYRALDSEQRETVLKVATVMRRPPPRKRGG